MNTKLLLILVLVFGTIGMIWGQSTGDYRTRYTGTRDWNTATNWQRFNGTGWATAPSVPTSSDGVITIQNNANYRVNTDTTLDQLVIASGGTLQINIGQTVTIANGTGTDFSVNGTLNVLGTVTVQSSATMSVAGTITFTGTSTVTGDGSFALNSGATLDTKNVSGISTSNSGSVRTATKSFNSGANYMYSASDAQMNTGNALPSSVNRLTVNAGEGLVLTNDVTISTELVFTDGWLVLGNNDVVFSDGASVNGAAWLYYNGTGHVVDLEEADTIEIEYTTPHELPPYVNNVILRDNVVLPNDIIVETVDCVEYYFDLNGNKVTCNVKSIAFSGEVRISATDLDMEEVSQTAGTGVSIERTWYTGGYVTEGTLTIDFMYPQDISPGSPVKLWRKAEAEAGWVEVGEFSPVEGDPMVLTVTGVTDLWDGNESRYMWTISAEDQTLPVELSAFNATLISYSRVRLNWVTQSETGVSGFYLLRGNTTNIANALLVSPLILATNSSTETVYAFDDREIPTAGDYYYWLQSEDINGATSYYGPVQILVSDGGDNPPAVPIITKLNQPYPNPFNPTLNIGFDVATASSVKIEIYNVKGQLINTIFNGQKQPGIYTIRWDGKDTMGHKVSTGAYYVKMSAGAYDSTRKVVMIK